MEGDYILEIVDILKIIAPGTQIRAGIDNILKAKTGGLIVIGDGKEIQNIIDGGFFVDVEFSPARLYELAKMDGAIILSEDLKRILYANAQLIPDFSITTVETGTRHRTAERVAKQTGKIVISISQRRGIITIYYGNSRYVLEDTAKVMAKSNQALQTVEKYRIVFNNKINLLNEYEFNDIATLNVVVETIQRGEMLYKIAEEVQKSIYELGTEGRLLKMQLDELTDGIEQEEKLVIKDYIQYDKNDKSKTKGKEKVKNQEKAKGQNSNDENDDIEIEEAAFKKIRGLSYEDLMKEQLIANILGIKENDNFSDVSVYTRGYRILSRVPRMPSFIVDNIVKKFGSWQKILSASAEELDEVDGIGEIRAKTIVQSLKRMQEQYMFDSMI
jgi:diadenylate cyclase